MCVWVGTGSDGGGVGKSPRLLTSVVPRLHNNAQGEGRMRRERLKCFLVLPASREKGETRAEEEMEGQMGAGKAGCRGSAFSQNTGAESRTENR